MVILNTSLLTTHWSPLWDCHQICNQVPQNLIVCPHDNSGARGFDYTLNVANKFDNIVINNNLYNISVYQLRSTYQNHVLHNVTYKEFWANAMTDTKDIKNDDGTYKPNAFRKIATPFSSTWLPMDALLPVAAGNYLLHYMHSGKKNNKERPYKPFLLLDCCDEKELDNEEAKVLFFYSFLKEHINDYMHHGNYDFDSETLEDLKNSSIQTTQLLQQPRPSLLPQPHHFHSLWLWIWYSCCFQTFLHINQDKNPHHSSHLMATAIAKIPRQPLIDQLVTQTMNLTKNLISMTSP